MSYQPSVTQYFSNRKRPAIDEKNRPSKLVVLDALSSHGARVNNEVKNELTNSVNGPKVIIASKQKSVASQCCQNLSVKKSSKKIASSNKLTKEPKISQGIQQEDIRKTFLNLKNNELANTEEEASVPNYNEKDPVSQTVLSSTPEKNLKNVSFKKGGPLSPMRTKFRTDQELKEENGQISGKKYEKDSENKEMASRTSVLRNELNLGQIKAKLTRSSRLEEMKQALERINKSKAELTKVQEKLNNLDTPTLEKFDSVQLEIPYASPMKTVSSSSRSPSKFTPSRLFNEPPPSIASPIKSPFKSPAFQRYQALVTEGRSALTLPFKYRALAEMFHCVDTVVSMFYNRKETITFTKLKPAVEEMKKRALTEYQLGQIKTVFPQGFDFHQDKVHKFGSMQSDKYELVITPLVTSSDKDSGKCSTMTPTCLLERKRAFYNTLLDMTKTCHEEFLTNLDPPMNIPRERLTRWHPNFDVDGVPDIISSALPQPPNVEKITSAKDVLERSRALFMANPRLQRALQRVSESNSSSQSSSPASTPAPTPVSLKGIPKCLLEKIRAKQAAKAMEVMTRTPAEAKEAVRLTRLPEIARIIRNLFVAEKKSVLPRDLVLKKLDDSYRENLTISELDDHVKLLSDHTPGWMAFCNIRKTDYIKLSKNADMLRIMKRLEGLAAEKEF